MICSKAQIWILSKSIWKYWTVPALLTCWCPCISASVFSSTRRVLQNQDPGDGLFTAFVLDWDAALHWFQFNMILGHFVNRILEKWSCQQHAGIS